MKRKRHPSEVIKELSKYIAKAKTDQQATNHILMEILAVGLEIRDALVEEEFSCDFHVKGKAA